LLAISAKPDRAVSQRWNVKGERSGLPMRIAAMESVSSCERMKLDAFLEVERATKL